MPSLPTRPCIPAAAMLKKAKIRRSVALLLVAFGAIAMFLAPEPWTGLALLALGVLLELVGIALRGRGSR